MANQVDEDKTTDIEENVPEIGSVPDESEQKDKGKNSKDKKPKPFPSYDIKESLKIAKAIKDNNAGNPWASSELSKAIAINSTSLFYLSAASRDYGFTTGTNRAKTVELTALGRKFVFASSGQDEADAVLKAFNNIPLFKDVYEYYKGGSLPDIKYLSNTLIDKFDLSEEYHQEFISIFNENTAYMSEVGLTTNLVAKQSVATHIPSSIISKTSTDKGLFVIMPFTEKTDKYSTGFFDEVFSSLIVPAAAEVGFNAVTANKSGSDIIQATIVNDIFNADLILVDLTEHNPNVLFELGLAIAFEKKVALIRAKGTPQIFDVDNLLRVFDYDPNLWKSTIERDVPNLSKHIVATNDRKEKSYLEVLKRG
jgi:hypothetical protein